METKVASATRPFLTVGQAAKEIGVSYSLVMDWCRNGLVAAKKLRRGINQTAFRISPSEVDRVKKRRLRNLPL
jgi:predicted site-specific integrase-resolvase